MLHAGRMKLVFLLFLTPHRNVAVLTETIRKGVHDADSEARSVARK